MTLFLTVPILFSLELAMQKAKPEFIRPGIV